MQVHHTLEEYIDAYIDHTEIREEPKSWLFRTDNHLDRTSAWKMVRRRAKPLVWLPPLMQEISDPQVM
ncbi:hypothetical protein [Hoeflea poritis]|uniref:Uncharacterized protein n=1 Tax=Hoeflea poritis TaxID=2993659 RepID=A0ABT4VXH8_9HYPH|nr:hypothetical protein [Hoeflea poritis]MDA4848708.1 hypothetical protein [Hoeflea poritis]